MFAGPTIHKARVYHHTQGPRVSSSVIGQERRGIGRFCVSLWIHERKGQKGGEQVDCRNASVGSLRLAAFADSFPTIPPLPPPAAAGLSTPMCRRVWVSCGAAQSPSSRPANIRPACLVLSRSPCESGPLRASRGRRQYQPSSSQSTPFGRAWTEGGPFALHESVAASPKGMNPSRLNQKTSRPVPR